MPSKLIRKPKRSTAPALGELSCTYDPRTDKITVTVESLDDALTKYLTNNRLYLCMQYYSGHLSSDKYHTIRYRNRCTGNTWRMVHNTAQQITHIGQEFTYHKTIVVDGDTGDLINVANRNGGVVKLWRTKPRVKLKLKFYLFTGMPSYDYNQNVWSFQDNKCSVLFWRKTKCNTFTLKNY